jgi:hypothetical protein
VINVPALKHAAGGGPVGGVWTRGFGSAFGLRHLNFGFWDITSPRRCGFAFTPVRELIFESVFDVLLCGLAAMSQFGNAFVFVKRLTSQ